MYHIALITALLQEKKVCEAFLREKSLFPLVKVTLHCMGVGGYVHLMNLQKYLFSSRVDFVVSIGICGTKEKSFFPSIQASRIVSLCTGKEYLCPIYKVHTQLVTLAQSEKVVKTLDDMKQYLYVDMESIAVYLACQHAKIPFSIIRFPCDRIGESFPVSFDDIKRSIRLQEIREYLSQIETFLSKRITKHDEYLEHLYTHYPLTQSEKKKLEYYFYKELSQGKDPTYIVKTVSLLSLEELKKMLRTLPY